MLTSSNVVRLVDRGEARADGMMTVVIMMPGAKSSLQTSGVKNRRDEMIAIGMIDMTETHHTEEVNLALAAVDGMMMITLMLVVTTHLSLTPTMVNHRQETKEEEAEVTLEEVVNVVEGVEGEVDAVIEEIGEVEEVGEEMEGRMLVKEAVTMIPSQVVLSRST